MNGPGGIAGACLCGKASFTLSSRPAQLVDCNCSACRRYRGLWAHMPVDQVSLFGETNAFSRPPHKLAFHFCPQCGCTTHWLPLEPQQGAPWMAINMAMADTADLAGLTRRKFDGANSWSFLE